MKKIANKEAVYQAAESLRSPVPMCAWGEHKDRDQWEETGELIDRLGVFFKDRRALLADHPKLQWLLGWSHYLR